MTFDWLGPVAGAVVGFAGSFFLTSWRQSRVDRSVRLQLAELAYDLAFFIRRELDPAALPDRFISWAPADARFLKRSFESDTAAATTETQARKLYLAIEGSSDALYRATELRQRQFSDAEMLSYKRMLIVALVRLMNARKALGFPPGDNEYIKPKSWIAATPGVEDFD